jgi:hypothetical protein
MQPNDPKKTIPHPCTVSYTYCSIQEQSARRRTSSLQPDGQVEGQDPGDWLVVSQIDGGQNIQYSSAKKREGYKWNDPSDCIKDANEKRGT